MRYKYAIVITYMIQALPNKSETHIKIMSKYESRLNKYLKLLMTVV